MSGLLDIDDVCAAHPLAQQQLAEMRAELEIERSRLAACGVVAWANTPASAIEARKILPEYMSASCEDVARAVDREMALRAELAEAKRDAERINWIEAHKICVFTVEDSVHIASTATTGPRYFKQWKFVGWATRVSDSQYPTIREAIDAAMAGGEHGDA